jgi:TolB-like protein
VRGLNFCIALLRSPGGDSAEAPRYIETEPKRGYRFIGAVPSPAVLPQTELAAARVRWTPRAVAIAATLLLAAALVSAIAAMSGDDRVRLAVFPFDNETADSAYEGIAGGIADETVSRLSTPDRLARVDVIGNAAILREPRTFRDLRKVGRNLGAQYVLLAQLKRDDKGVRVIAHLIRVSDEAHVWAQTFDRADFSLATQTEIAEAIAAAVSARL